MAHPESVEDRIMLVVGDIAAERVDAVVNAANPELAPGGGVAGAIHAAAGPGLWEECRRMGGCPTGGAKVTRGHGLPARHVIHTVAPVWRGGLYGEDDLLAACYKNSFRVATQLRLHTLAFPALGTGAYGFPPDRGARIAVRETVLALRREPHLSVRFVLFDEEARRSYERALATRAHERGLGDEAQRGLDAPLPV